jgi:D-alanine-D-alanine ligase
MAGRWKGKKVGVIMGGISKEREISLKTGTAVGNALMRRGYDVVLMDVGEDTLGAVQKAGIDAAVIALHGKFGEDGCIQGMLEMMRIPYSGAGVLGSSVAMDKIVCNRVVRQLGITVPDEVIFTVGEDDPERFADTMMMDFPVIVKPSREGSTINVTIVEQTKDLPEAIVAAGKSDNKVLVEKYIKGKEVTVGVINGKALPTLEIAPKDGFYDFEHKYTKGRTEYIVPARIDEKLSKKLMGWSEQVFRAIECSGAARADYIVDGSGKAFFLEINTVPGMTELSLVPMAAAKVDMSFDDVAEAILESASLKVSV